MTDTNLQDEEFETASIERSDNDWGYCHVVDNIYKGCGGTANLEEIIEIFQVWHTEKK